MTDTLTVQYKFLTVLTLVCGSSGPSADVVSCKIYAEARRGRELTFDEGSNVTLKCMVVSNLPAHNFTWVKNDRVVKKYTEAGRYSNFSLFNITARNEGSYICVAKSKDITGKCQIKIHINVLPTIKPMRLFELVLVGLPVEIPCSATGWPVPTVRWLRHGQEITNNKSGFFVTKHKKNEARLTTNHMLKVYEGKYNCVATNTLGQDSKVVTLMPHVYVSSRPQFQGKGLQPAVTSPLVFEPQVKAFSSEVISTLGSNASLHCRGVNAFHNRRTFFYWMFKGESSAQNPRWFSSLDYNQVIEDPPVVNFSLLIVNVSNADIGIYTCFVELLHAGAYNASMHLRLASLVVKDDELYNTGPPKKYWIITAGVFAGTLLLGLVAYWLRRGRKLTYHDSLQDDQENSKYDVFVSYSGRDFNWVQEHFLPLLDSYHIKYCIHSRDFEPGKPVIQNMADSVFGSHVTVAIISSNYVTSKFCQEELNMAVFKNKAAKLPSSVLAVRIDSINRKKLPKILRRTTFLDYVDSSQKQTWDRRLMKHLLSKIEISKSWEKAV